jgi:nucleotide-binding universal stress UspA family protein
MGQLLDLDGSVPDLRAPVDDRGGQFRRVLVPIDLSGPANKVLALALRMGRTTSAQLRLVHVRIWDPPLPRGGGRFYSETSEDAIAVLEGALTSAWACEVEASGVVVDAERSRVAAAILAEASTWGADVIVLTQPIRRIMSHLGLWDKASRQVIRGASCPVLIVYQGRV